MGMATKISAGRIPKESYLTQAILAMATKISAGRIP